MIELRLGFLIVLSLLLSGCLTFPTYESEQVNVLWDQPDQLAQCTPITLVYGSEGHFYDFWLHADQDMLWATVNQMRIATVELGGDTLYLYSPPTFSSSVTLMGKAFDCGNGIQMNPLQTVNTQ